MEDFMICMISIGVTALIACAAVVLWWVLSKDKQNTRDIIENVNETIIIFDQQDKPSYVHIVPARNNNEFVGSIERDIKQAGVLPEDFKSRCLEGNNSRIYEGVIKPYTEVEDMYSWKMRPIVRNRKYYGCIYVFSDITQYMKLHEEIEKQNKELHEAYEQQRKYVEVVRQLGTEEERERIMNIVNGISREYLRKLDESIGRMEKYAEGSDPKDIEAYEEENGQMIQITRDTISRVRSTVKELHSMV